jgi:signal transduction histidine kinase
MEQAMQQAEEMAGIGRAERKRVEAVVETLAILGCRGESAAELAHDARNMVTALGLYCDLLEEPGVLANPFAHYGSELRLVATASRRLVEKLAALDRGCDTNFNAAATGRGASRSIAPTPGRRFPQAASASSLLDRGRPVNKRNEAHMCWDLMPASLIGNLAAELLATHNLLAALAGPSIALTVDVEGGARPVRLTGEDLTRVLVNLVKNAAEAMPKGGCIQIGLRELPAAAGAAAALALTVEDSGPGMPEQVLEEIFASGYTTRAKCNGAGGSWAVTHRGLGLSIARSIVEAAGGRIFASNRVPAGACFQIELPVRKAGFYDGSPIHVKS